MTRLLRFLIFGAVLLAGLYLGGVYAYQNRLYAPISDRISDETKDWLKNNVLVFQAKAELEDEVAALQRRIDQTDDVQQLFETALRNDPNLPERLPFALAGTQTYETALDRFETTSYETPFVPLDYFGRRAYLETYQGDLLLVTAKGTVGRMPLADIKGDRFSMASPDTNLHTLIQYPEFYALGEMSIKDVLVMGDQLLLSYSKALRDGCITIAIAAADLGDAVLTFNDTFVPDECVDEENDYGEFSGNQSGGRMLQTGPQALLLTTGEMRYRNLAQDLASFFGKVLAIDLATGTWEVKSMGHRNPQGLYYDAAANVIVTSEHGPEGGDELNINRTPDGEIENYGWPISSYGEHYTTDQATYDKAPLYESHADYGFIEPDLHWEPSISPAQILRRGPDPRNPDRYALMMGTMGFDYREGDESLHIFEMDADFRVTGSDRIVLDDRVRDMIALPEPNHYALYLEGDSYEFGTIMLMTVSP